MLEELIRRARRRFILNEALGQTAFALALFATGFILILLTGTRYLSAWSLAIFAAAGIVIGVIQLRRRTPDPYTAAQELDRKAALQDALSTAWHFRDNSDPAMAAFRENQHRQAEAAAETVALNASLPFTIPRTAYVMAALALVATGLVAIRFRSGHGLDLQRPITEVLFEDQNVARPKMAAKTTRTGEPTEWSEEARDLLSKLGIKPDFDEKGDPDALDKAIEQALQPANQGGDPNSPGQKGQEGKKDGAQQADKNSNPVDGDNKDNKGDSTASKDSKGSDSNGTPNPSKKSDDQKGLMSALRNAVQSMLNKNQQPGDQQKGDKQQGQQDKKDASKQENGPGQGTPEQGNGDDNAESDPNGDPMGGQKGKSDDTSASTTPQKQEGSGIGLADGSKDIRAAEQAKAMGKISEIIGKRQKDVSGETMIEVESGRQQLRTGYSQVKATHAETDGDVTRDEIPLALQPYVQQYFSAVHKADAAADSKKK